MKMVVDLGASVNRPFRLIMIATEVGILAS